MAHSHSSEDSDSSPSSTSSSSRDDNLVISGAMPPLDSNVDPESPNATQQSSDESGCSDGVLVELPGNNDQDSRSMPGDPESGILVNIDGSMQEQQERDDLFLDASDHLGSGGRTPRPMESATMAEPVEVSRRRRSREQDMERNQARLDAIATECQKYKEERDAFGREVMALCAELQGLINQQFMNKNELVEYDRPLEDKELELDVLASPTPLQSIVKDCFKCTVQLKYVLDKRLNSVNGMLNGKDHEIEVLNSKILEDDVLQNVLISYLGSVGGVYSQSMHEYVTMIARRLLALLPVMDGTETESVLSELSVDGISLIEKRTMLLVEKHNQSVLEIEQLGRFMEEIKPGSLTSKPNEPGLVFALVREELLERRSKEGELEGNIRVLEEENMKMAKQIIDLNKAKEEVESDMSKIKTELEQTEGRFLGAKEKLSIAVTKGKQLVQHRDSLKQSLADKTNEFDKCVQELQQKTNTLQLMEASNAELQQLLLVKTNELDKCLLELHDKSNFLGRNEAIIEELNQSLQKKADELEKCLQELKQKSDAFDNANTDANETKQLLVENKDQLENCLIELEHKSKELETYVANAEKMKQSFTMKICDLEMSLLNSEQNSNALETAEATVQQLKQALSEKDIELEKFLLELQEKSDLIAATNKEFNELQNLVLSLQGLATWRDNVLKEIEEISHDANLPQDLLSLDIVDKFRWLVTKAHISDDILQENYRVKDALFSVGVPQSIASAKLDSQVEWLVRLLSKTNDELTRLQSEVTQSSTLHESELSEASTRVDSLVESLLKEKEEKESLIIKIEHLKADHEKFAENLALISFEKERFIKFVKEICTTYLDDQPTLDMDAMLEKSISYIRKNLMSSNDGKKLEGMQNILYITHVERTFFEKVLEEMQVDESKMTILSNELGKASKEVNALRNEKESMQKEIVRIEERNSLLRDKLSMAVKKGKGLVQEREVLKVTLDEKKAEIEKLKEELQLQESKVCEYMEQIKSFSSYPEKLLKVELDIASLKVKIEQSEHLLSESNDNLQKLVDSINDINIHTDNVFEAPMDKVIWIAKFISETENAKAYLEEELEKARGNANLNYSRFAEALEAIKSLEIELEKKENHVRNIYDEMNNIQFTKSKIEEDLEKAREESFILANKLADSYATIKPLEDKLLLEEDKVFALIAEKNEIVSKSNLEISALNAKLAESLEEVAKAQGSSESQLAEILSELKQLEIFIKNEGLFPLIVEQFHKKADGLRHMWILIQDIHDNLLAKDPTIYSEMERVLSKFSSPTNFEELTKNENFHTETLSDDAEAVTSCKRIVKAIYQRSRFLHDELTGFSISMGDYITFTLQALEASRDEFIQSLHLSESLKLNIEKLEERNRAQEFEISSLQTEALNLVKMNKEVSISLESFKHKLNHTEITAAATLDEKKLVQERVSKLEGEIEALQNVCNEMKATLNDYESKERVIKEREIELEQLERSLIAKGREVGDEIISKVEVENLFEKVNKLTVLACSSHQSESQSEEVCFSRSVDKLFYVVDKFSEFQQGVLSMAFEKDNLQLIIENHVREIENLRSSVKSLSTENLDLQSKEWQLNEVTSILEKITQEIAEHYPFEGLRPTTAMGLVQVVERQMAALSMDLSKSESQVHELRRQLQANDVFIDGLSAKVKYLEDSHARIQQPDVVKERTVFESSSTTMRPEITEVEEGSVGLSSKNPISASAHVRTMRKGSNDHLVLNIDSESERLLTSQETDDKGHVFKSLNTSGLIPKQGRLIADRVDGIWVSGGRMLMAKPAARLGLIAYCTFLHLWLLAVVL